MESLREELAGSQSAAFLSVVLGPDSQVPPNQEQAMEQRNEARELVDAMKASSENDQFGDAEDPQDGQQGIESQMEVHWCTRTRVGILRRRRIRINYDVEVPVVSKFPTLEMPDPVCQKCHRKSAC